jgi:hypothetical protein
MSVALTFKVVMYALLTHSAAAKTAMVWSDAMKNGLRFWRMLEVACIRLHQQGGPYVRSL